jgi:glycosidase
MLRFLENHDEQRIASEAFAGGAKAGIPGMLVTVLMNAGGSLIYFGQELGEDAGEAEGFSSLDGRTTIFDYWSISRYQRWVHDGRFDETGLMPEEQSLRHFYQTLLQAKLNEPALREGGFYDLMYANSHLNGDTVYAFARHKEDSVFLVVCNFDRDAPQEIQVFIPEHFFQHIGHAFSTTYSAVDLLGGECPVRISAQSAGEQGIRISLDPLSGCMIKMYA